MVVDVHTFIYVLIAAFALIILEWFATVGSERSNDFGYSNLISLFLLFGSAVGIVVCITIEAMLDYFIG